MSYSILTSLYISTVALSVILITFLLYVLLFKSSYYFTKWTVFQLYVSLLLYSTINVTPLAIYGDDLINQTFDDGPKKLICILQKDIGEVFIYPVCLFPLVLAFYQWYAIAKNNLYIENLCFWYFTIVIWGASIAYTLWNTFADKKERFWGTMVGHSLCILFVRWKNYEKYYNRLTAIRLVTKPKISDNGDIDKAYYFSDYVNSTSGIVAFLIFGTTKSAVFFLPCCYYSPPDEILSSGDKVIIEINEAWLSSYGSI
nr:5927_t:CDS:2 [Entrophospora candida]